MTDKLDQAKLDVITDYDASYETRDLQNKDMRFVGVTGGMWEDYLRDTHNDETNRARLELDMTSDIVNSFYGEWTNNRANVIFTPGDEATSEEDAELLSGVYRADFKDNDGQIAHDQAVYEVAVCGAGDWKIKAVFVDEEDPENEDQEIAWEPIVNAFNHVMWDSNSKNANKSDAMRCTVLTAHSRDAFEDEWPDAQPSSAYIPPRTGEFTWSTVDVIYTAQQYKVNIVKQEIEVWRNVDLNKTQGYKKEEMEELKPELEALGWEFVRTRKIQMRQVTKSLFTGLEFLEEPTVIAGKWIPIIHVAGYRTYVDNQEHARGLVRKNMDPNRLLNTGISKIAETSAVSGNELPILTPDQMEGDMIKSIWQNRHKASYLLARQQTDAEGNKIPLTGVPTLKPAQMDPNAIGSIDIVTNFLQNQNVGAAQDTIDPNASGKAVNAMIKQGQKKTIMINDNIMQAIKHEGNVWRAMAADVYTRSQMKRVLNETGEIKVEQLNVQSLDPQSGNPIMVNDFTKGRFAVDVVVGNQYETEAEATIESIERVIEKVGGTPGSEVYMGPLLAMWMENINGDGLKPLKKFNRQLMLQQGLIEPETDEEKQQLQALQNQEDPQAELNAAIANQQNAEAEELRSKQVVNITTARKNQATALKTEAETAQIVQEVGLQRADAILQRFSQITPAPAGS